MQNNDPKKEITDINDLVLSLAVVAMKPLLSDGIWQCYGYKKTPRHGSIWTKMFPKKFELEDFITKEILTMGLIDVLNGIKKSTETTDAKLLLSIGVVDQFLPTIEHLFTSEEFMENLFSTYASYLKNDKSNLHAPIILKAKNILNKKDFAKFMVGTIKLLAIERADDYLLNSNYIKDVIDKSSTENKLNISLSEETWRKYGELLSKKILNA